MLQVPLKGLGARLLMRYPLFLQGHVKSMVKQDYLCPSKRRGSHQHVAGVRVSMDKPRVEDLVAEHCDHFVSYLREGGK